MVRVVDRFRGKENVYEMTLEEYFGHVLWGAKKRRYAEAFPDAGCFICGRRDYQLHHLRYDNLGQEAWDELIPLCPDHHYEIEKHINKGIDGVPRENAHVRFCPAEAPQRGADPGGTSCDGLGGRPA